MLVPTRRCAFTVVELLCVAAAAAVLLTLVCPLIWGTRKQAKVAVARSRLRQVGGTLDLYSRQYLRYPKDGLELWRTVSSSLGDSVCRNPFREEIVPGYDLAALYRPRQLSEIDRPGLYLASFPAAKTGGPMVVLETGGRVTQRRCPGYVEGQTQLSQWVSFFYPQATIASGGFGGPTWGTMSYAVLRDTASTIKFEGAPVGLGEDGVAMTDVFAIQLDTAPESVTVIIKAGESTSQSVLDLTPRAQCTDALGFHIRYAGNEGGLYRFEITARDTLQAVSHVVLDCAPGAVTTPAGQAEVPRMMAGS